MFSSANHHLSYVQRSSRNKENVYGNLKSSHSYPTDINSRSQMFNDAPEDLRHGYVNSNSIFERQVRQSTSANFGMAGNHLFTNACPQLSGVRSACDESNLRPQSLSGASMSEVRAILQENCNLLSDKTLYHDLINSIDSKLSMSSSARSVSSAMRPVGFSQSTLGLNRRRGDQMGFCGENTGLFSRFDHQQLGNSSITARSQVRDSRPASFTLSEARNNVNSNLIRNEFSEEQFYTPVKVLDSLELMSSPALLQKRLSSTPMSKINSDNQAGYIPVSAVRNLDVSLSISDISSALGLRTPLKELASHQPRGTNVTSRKKFSETINVAPRETLSQKVSISDVCPPAKKIQVFDADMGDLCESKQESREEGDTSESTAAKHVTFRSPSLADVSERSEVVEEDSKATMSGPSLESEMTGAIKGVVNISIEEAQFQDHRVDASYGELFSEHSERTLVNVEVDDVPRDPLESSYDERRDRGDKTRAGSVLNSGLAERLDSLQALQTSRKVSSESLPASQFPTDHHEETAATEYDSQLHNATAPAEQSGGSHYRCYSPHDLQSSLERRGESRAMELKKDLATRHPILSASVLDTLQNTADLKPLCVELFHALNSERDRWKLADEKLEMNRASTVDLQRAHQMEKTARLEHQDAARALREQFEGLSGSWNREKSLLEEERNRLREEKRVLHEEKQRVQEEWSKMYQERILLERESSRLDGEMIKMQIKTDSAVKKKEALEREVEVLRFRCSSLQQSLLSLQEQLDAHNYSNRERTSHNQKPLLASEDTVQFLEETHSGKLFVFQLTEELMKEKLRGEVLLDNLLIIEERFLLAEKEKNHAQKCCKTLDYQLKLLMGAADEGLNSHDHNRHSNQGDVKYGQHISTVSLEVQELPQPLASVSEISPTRESLNVLDDRALEAHTPPLDLVAGTSDQFRSVPVRSSLPPIESSLASDCFVPAMTSLGTFSQSRLMHSYDDKFNQSELIDQNHVNVTVQESEKAFFATCEGQIQLPRLSSSSLESSTSSSSGTGDDFSNNDGNQTVRGKYPYSDEFADSTKKTKSQRQKESGDHSDLRLANCREKENSVSRQPCASDRGSRSAPEEPVEGPRSLPEFRCGRQRPPDKKEGSDDLYQLLASLRPFDGNEYCDEKNTTESFEADEKFEKVLERGRNFSPIVVSRYEDSFRGQALQTFPTKNTEKCSPNGITTNDNLLNNCKNDFMTSSPSQWNEPLNFSDVLRSSHAQSSTPDHKDARIDVGNVKRLLDRRQNANVVSTFPRPFSDHEMHHQSDKSEEVFVSTASVLIFDGTQVPTNAKNCLEGNPNSSSSQHPPSVVNDRDEAASQKPSALTDVSASGRKRADAGMLSCSLMRELDQEKEQLLQELRKLTAFDERTQGKQRKKKKRSPKRQQQQQQQHELSPRGAELQVGHHQLLEDYHQQHLYQQRLQQQLQRVEYLQQNSRRPLHNSPRDQFAFAQQEHHRSDLQKHLDTTTVSSLSFQFDSPTRDTTLEEGLLHVEQSSNTQKYVRLSSAKSHENMRLSHAQNADSPPRNVSGNSARCLESMNRISFNDRVLGPLAGGKNVEVEKRGREGDEGSTNSCPTEAARITLHKIDSMSSLMSRAVRNHTANS